MNFLSEHSVCDWSSKSKSEQQQQQQDDTNEEQSLGILCNEDFNVIYIDLGNNNANWYDTIWIITFVQIGIIKYHRYELTWYITKWIGHFNEYFEEVGMVQNWKWIYLPVLSLSMYYITYND